MLNLNHYIKEGQKEADEVYYKVNDVTLKLQEIKPYIKENSDAEKLYGDIIVKLNELQMMLHNEKLNESEVIDKINKIPTWVKEELQDKGKADVWYCDDCDKYFKEPNVVRTDMENYHGVGDLFSDHHYQDFVECPYCEGNLEEITLNIDDLVGELMEDEEAYEKIYNMFCERYPELVHSDLYLEDYPDQVYEIAKEMI